MITLNEGQQFVVDSAIDWFYNSPEQTFQFDGPPGSGKSVTLKEIINRLGLLPYEVAPMAYIGCASLVMRKNGFYNAKTIHSWLYKPVECDKLDKDGNVVINPIYGTPEKEVKFIPVEYLDPNIKLIIIDEAYAVPYRMRPEIEKLGIKILACGDPFQLPPVENGGPAFLTSEDKVYHLSQVMRQQGKDDIIQLANMVRVGKRPPLYSSENLSIINPKDFDFNLVFNADMVICTKNSTRDNINRMVRKTFGYSPNFLVEGDKVICKNNNWNISIDTGEFEVSMVNGLIGTVLNPRPYDAQTFLIDFIPDMAPGVLFTNIKCDMKYFMSDHDTRKYLKYPGHKNFGVLIEYAYAITAHSAQGSQASRVIYIEERSGFDLWTQNSVNLVGATRATDYLLYVKGY